MFWGKKRKTYTLPIIKKGEKSSKNTSSFKQFMHIFFLFVLKCAISQKMFSPLDKPHVESKLEKLQIIAGKKNFDFGA